MKRAQLKLEYIFRASPQILYQFLTTPSCLIRWFCDNVEIDGGNYTFYWGESSDEATVVEAYGLKVSLVEGEETNIKITTPIDIQLAENLLAVIGQLLLIWNQKKYYSQNVLQVQPVDSDSEIIGWKR